MKGVTFGSYHSFDDFNLILSQKRIGTPSPKTNVIDIAGGDGVLDLTEYFGDVKYNNRSISFDFSTTVPQAQFMDLFSRVQNALHGQKMRITLDDDPEFYYVGRISVSEWKADKSIGKLTIDCDCEPWKYKQNETVVSVTVDGTTNNFYSPDYVSIITNPLKRDQEQFISLKVETMSDAIRYFNFFSRPSVELNANTAYSIIIEMQRCNIEGAITLNATDVQNALVYDYFTKRESIDLLNKGIGILKIFPASTRNEMSSSTFFMRSFISVFAKSKCDIKFRISVIEGDVSTDNFIFTSNDGMMKGIRLNNHYKKIVPTIVASAPCTILFEGKSIAINAGTFKIPEIELKQGINDIAVKGLATVTFAYQEGGL